MARAILCGALLLLPACHLPTLGHPEPGPDLPASYNGPASPDVPESGLKNSSRLGVEEFYKDPQLSGLIRQAMANNRELKSLEQEVQIAQNEALARQGAYLPFVSLRGNASVEKHSFFTPLGAVERQLEYFPGKHFPDPLPDFLLSLNFLWHPDIWRGLRNARDAAQQRAFAAVERRNFFVTRLVAEVAENYYSLMALDKRLENLDRTIVIQEQSLEIAKARFKAARITELAVQRFQAEVRRSQSEKLIVRQEIVEVENHINYLLTRYSEPVERNSAGFFDLNINALCVGVPSQLLQNRPDIRQAERDLEAAGLDVKTARSHFFPDLNITGAVGYESFNPKYLFNTPDALIYNTAGDVVAPLVNRYAIKAEYRSANARQLQAVYNYQRIILNAFTEVVTRVSRVENYRKSVEVKKQQLQSLDLSVDIANKLFQNARVEYVEVLLAQRELLEARTVLIETKRQQLAATVNAYQALGGGDLLAVPSDCAGGSW